MWGASPPPAAGLRGSLSPLQDGSSPPTRVAALLQQQQQWLVESTRTGSRAAAAISRSRRGGGGGASCSSSSPQRPHSPGAAVLMDAAAAVAAELEAERGQAEQLNSRLRFAEDKILQQVGVCMGMWICVQKATGACIGTKAER